MVLRARGLMPRSRCLLYMPTNTHAFGQHIPSQHSCIDTLVTIETSLSVYC